MCMWRFGGMSAREQQLPQPALSFNEKENAKARRRKVADETGVTLPSQEYGEAGWPSWGFGTKESVGSNHGLLFIYSTEARPGEGG
jgi:hypothetical protein